MNEATSYQRLREHLAYLGITSAAEHLSAELDGSLKHKLSPTQVLGEPARARGVGGQKSGTHGHGG